MKVQVYYYYLLLYIQSTPKLSGLKWSSLYLLMRPWIRNLGSLRKYLQCALASSVFSLYYAGRSKKLTHASSIHVLPCVLSSSPIRNTRFLHKMAVTYTSYMADGFQGRAYNKGAENVPVSLACLELIPCSFWYIFLVKVSNRAHLCQREGK